MTGGVAYSKAVDGSTIKMTGSGTITTVILARRFQNLNPVYLQFLHDNGVDLGAPAGEQGSKISFMGGGTWETFDAENNSSGSGTYWVTGLTQWNQAPGADPSLSPLTLIDGIGNPEEWSAGLAVLLIEYSDGEKGTLVVNCRFDASPPIVPEGISATKGFVSYYDLQIPVDGVDENRTVFHVRR